MRDTAAKRRLILEKARALFLNNGFEGTSFAKLSDVSGAAIGSIVHFFGNKAALAAAVHDEAAAPLVEDAKAALQGHPKEVAAAIRALLSTCYAWPATFANNRRLIDLLEARLGSDDLVQGARLQARLAHVLFTWAEPLTPRLLPPLLPIQLYAVVLAPVLCAATPSIIRSSDSRQKSSDWLERLVAAALTAIGQSRDDVNRPATGESSAGARRRRSAVAPG